MGISEAQKPLNGKEKYLKTQWKKKVKLKAYLDLQIKWAHQTDIKQDMWTYPVI